MLPVLEEGDLIVALAVRRPEKLDPDTIVRVEHPHFGPMVKRLVRIEQDGQAVLSSDGQTGADHADLGPVPAKLISHRLLWRIRARNNK